MVFYFVNMEKLFSYTVKQKQRAGIRLMPIMVYMKEHNIPLTYSCHKNNYWELVYLTWFFYDGHDENMMELRKFIEQYHDKTLDRHLLNFYDEFIQILDDEDPYGVFTMQFVCKRLSKKHSDDLRRKLGWIPCETNDGVDVDAR